MNVPLPGTVSMRPARTSSLTAARTVAGLTPSSTINVRTDGRVALGALGVLIFSLSLPATRVAVPVFGGWTVGIGRAVLAGGLAVVVLLVRRPPRPARAQLPGLLLVVGGVIVGFPLFTAPALEHVPASRGAIGVLPAATALVATLRHGERPSWLFWLAATGGLITVIAFAVLTGADGRPQAADGFLLLAVAAAAVGYAEGGVLGARIGGWQTICWALVLALPITVPVSALALSAHGVDRLTAPSLIGLGYVSVFSMFLGFFA